MKIKNYRAWLWIGLTAGSLLACACRARERTGGKESGQAPGGPQPLRVLCSFLPIWAFTENVVGDRPGIQVSVLIPGSQGPHDYQLSPADMMKINQADLFIVNGYYLEEFLTSAAEKTRPGLKIVKAGEAAAPILAGGEGVNPHPFASPRDAAKMVQRIAEALTELDPAGRETYLKNAAAYEGRLNALADQLRAVVQAAPNKKIVTFHNAFDYLARDTGLQIVGSIETVPGQEPSAGELAALVQTIKNPGAVAVFSEPQFSPRLAQVVAEETGVPIAELDPTHTGEMRPDYYERAMKKNLETLRQALDKGKQ